MRSLVYRCVHLAAVINILLLLTSTGSLPADDKVSSTQLTSDCVNAKEVIIGDDGASARVTSLVPIERARITLTQIVFVASLLPALGARGELREVIIDSVLVETSVARLFRHPGRIVSLSLSNTDANTLSIIPKYNAPCLRTLLFDETRISDESLVWIRDSLTLTALDLSRTQVTDAGLSQLSAIHSLANLRLNSNGISGEGLETFGRCHRLLSIDLGGTRLSRRGIIALGQFRSLQELNIDSTTVDPEIMSRSLRQFADLRRFSANWVNLGGDAELLGDDFVRHLGCHSRLEHVALKGAGIGKDGLQCLSGLSQLRSLDIASTVCDREAVAAIGLCRSLESLCLSGVRTKGVNIWDSIGETLARLSRLRVLEIAGTSIRDEHIRLLNSVPLTELNVEHTSLTDKCIDELLRIKTLTQLKVGGAGITRDGGARLRSGVPQCVVIGVVNGDIEKK